MPPIVRPAASRGKSLCREAPPDHGCREPAGVWRGKGTSPDGVMSERRVLLGGQGPYCGDEVPRLRGAVWCTRHSDGGTSAGDLLVAPVGGPHQGQEREGPGTPGVCPPLLPRMLGPAEKGGEEEGGCGIRTAREGRGTTGGPARVL